MQVINWVGKERVPQMCGQARVGPRGRGRASRLRGERASSQKGPAWSGLPAGKHERRGKHAGAVLQHACGWASAPTAGQVRVRALPTGKRVWLGQGSAQYSISPGSLGGAVFGKRQGAWRSGLAAGWLGGRTQRGFGTKWRLGCPRGRPRSGRRPRLGRVQWAAVRPPEREGTGDTGGRSC